MELTNQLLDMSKLGFQGLKKEVFKHDRASLESVLMDLDGLPPSYVSPWAVEELRKAINSVLAFRGTGGRKSLGRVPIPSTNVLPETRDWLKANASKQKTVGQLIDDLVKERRDGDG